MKNQLIKIFLISACSLLLYAGFAKSYTFEPQQRARCPANQDFRGCEYVYFSRDLKPPACNPPITTPIVMKCELSPCVGAKSLILHQATQTNMNPPGNSCSFTLTTIPGPKGTQFYNRKGCIFYGFHIDAWKVTDPGGVTPTLHCSVP